MTTHGRGFTLIELVMTLAIVGMMASMALPMAELAVQRYREQNLQTALRQIRTGIDAYKQATDDGRVVGGRTASGYPPTLKSLVDGLADARNPDGKARIYFLRRIPRDPFFADPAVPDEDTWGKRSYASSADNPEEGEDLFDVYSHATGIGLNGIPYNRW